CAALAPYRPGRLPALRRGVLRSLQGVVRPLFLPAAPERDPRRGRTVLRRCHGWIRALVRAVAQRGRSFSARLHAHRRPAQGSALRRAGAPLSALPARPLRGVQHALRPRNPVRPAIAWPHRIHPDVPAAAGPMGLRLASRARVSGGPALRGFPAAQSLSGRTRPRLSGPPPGVTALGGSQLMSERKYVVFAQVLVNRPGALGAGLDDEDIACLERDGRLALDLDGASPCEQMTVFPCVVVDFPNARRRFPDAGKNFAVIGGM